MESSHATRVKSKILKLIAVLSMSRNSTVNLCHFLSNYRVFYWKNIARRWTAAQNFTLPSLLKLGQSEWRVAVSFHFQEKICAFWCTAAYLYIYAEISNERVSFQRNKNARKNCADLTACRSTATLSVMLVYYGKNGILMKRNQQTNYPKCLHTRCPH